MSHLPALCSISCKKSIQIGCVGTVFSILTAEKMKIGNTPVDLRADRLTLSGRTSVKLTPLEIALRMGSMKSR